MIIRFAEVWNGRTGSIDQSAVREYRRVFRAVTADAADGPLEILGEVGIPNMRDKYVDSSGLIDAGAIVTKITPRNDPENPFLWDIDVDYSSAPATVDQVNQTAENPLDRPAVYSWKTLKFQRPVFSDNSTPPKPIVNSAGDSYVPAPEMDDFRLALVVSRYESTLDPANLVNWNNATNSKAFLGLPALKWKVYIEAESVYENGIFCWHVTYTFEQPSDPVNGWQICIVDRGPRQKGSGGKLVPITDASGQPIENALLDGSGHQLTPTAQKPCVVNTFPVYPSFDFNILNIPFVVP